MMDRRKPHFENKDSERLGAIKEVLESLADTQKRMADAYLARTRAEERKAKAMEVLAKNLYRMINPNASASDVEALFAAAPYSESLREEEAAPVENIRPTEIVETAPDAMVQEREEEDIFASDGIESEENGNEGDLSGDEDEFSEAPGRLTEVDRHTLYALINQMRAEGHGWEKIARHISSQGYPTISGKGNWRGVTVKTLFEKIAP
ncbi:MAG: hypothetical protein HZB87_11280 [Desulfatitalea sp.]|nr:hypothetical protein [Desulfatitalea sp.]